MNEGPIDTSQHSGWGARVDMLSTTLMGHVDDRDIAAVYATAISAQIDRRVLGVSVRGCTLTRWGCADDDPRGAAIRAAVERGDLATATPFGGQPCHLECIELRSNGELIGIVEVLVDGLPESGIEFAALTRSATAFLAVEIRARMAEKSLENERARISLLSRHNVNPVAVMAADGRLVWVTEALAHSVGHSVEELIGTHCLDLVDPDQREAGRDLLSRLPALGVVTTTITLNVNGRQISGVCRAEFDPDTGGMVVIFVGDGNPENPMGDRAMRWMARFGSLLDALGEGVAMVDSAGTVRYSNIHMNELTGDDQMIIDLTDKVLQSGATDEVLGCQQLRVTDAAGRHHLIETVSEPLPLGHGDPGGGVIMVVRRLDRPSTPATVSDAAIASRPARPTRHNVPAGFEDLSAREWDVLHLLLDGYRVPSIAKRLYLSQHTVRNHLKAIFRKTRVSSQAELIERLRA